METENLLTELQTEVEQPCRCYVILKSGEFKGQRCGDVRDKCKHNQLKKVVKDVMKQQELLGTNEFSQDELTKKSDDELKQILGKNTEKAVVPDNVKQDALFSALTSCTLFIEEFTTKNTSTDLTGYTKNIHSIEPQVKEQLLLIYKEYGEQIDPYMSPMAVFASTMLSVAAITKTNNDKKKELEKSASS